MREKILAFLENFELEGGGNIISRDLMRALDVDGSKASFVLEAPSPDVAKSLDFLQHQAKEPQAQKMLLNHPHQVLSSSHGK